MQLTSNLDENIALFKQLLPIGKSFDLVARELYLGRTRAYFITINGMCRSEVLQQIFSDLQNPVYILRLPYKKAFLL